MPKIGHFVLHSNFLPQITAGRYELKTEQTGLPFTVAAETTHVFVAAPRFTMPTDQILSSFPPANAEGAFGDRLPQIVLKRRTLPWERNPTGATNPDPNKPWLALVVVAEGEAELSTAVPVAECVTPGTVLDLTDKDVEQGLYLAVTETVVKKIFPTEADLALLVHVRQVDIRDTELANGDDDGWLAVVLANRLPVFDTAGNKPVRYMACLVNVEGQLPSLPKTTPAVNHFEWVLAQDWSVLAAVAHESGDAVVMGGAQLTGVTLPAALAPTRASASRASTRASASPASARAGARAPLLPSPSNKATKPLAAGAFDGTKSMVQPTVADQWRQTTARIAAAAKDPDAKRLVRDTMRLGFRFPIGRYAVERVLRFPVLAHWSFTTSDGATFETLMQGLDVGLLGTLPAEPEVKPGKPLPPPRPAGNLPEVVATGHMSLAHRARRGDALRAWYRGPCVPFPTPRDGTAKDDPEVPLVLAHAADQLKRVIPDGREDLTLAAAFEIGRLLALSQLSVVSALLRFRAEQFGAGRVREILKQVLPYTLPELVANAGAQRVDLGRFVAVQMIDELAKAPERKLGPRRPVADPGRALKVEGDLDRAIATGLGLDLDALRKRGDQVGLLAALEEVAVPVIGRVGDGKVGTSEVQALRSALQRELRRTLDIAAPPKKPVLRRGRGAAAKGAPADDEPDALDQLIARAADQSVDESVDEGEDDQESPR